MDKKRQLFFLLKIRNFNKFNPLVSPFNKGGIRWIILFLSIIFLTAYSLCAKAENIIITNFINESGYNGDWDIENGLPGMIRESLIRKRQEIPIWRKRSWREDASDLKRKFPSQLVISGRIAEFSYTSNTAGAWPLVYKDTRASVEIILEIVDEGEIYTESCIGEEATKNFQIQILSASETEVDELAGVKFGDSIFESSLPGKATRKAIEKCIRIIDRYLDKRK